MVVVKLLLEGWKESLLGNKQETSHFLLTHLDVVLEVDLREECVAVELVVNAGEVDVRRRQRLHGAAVQHASSGQPDAVDRMSFQLCLNFRYLM